jgi:hypothetical protein
MAILDAPRSGGMEAVGEWLRWSDLRQTLVAGVGVFGLAAGIMALISSNALLMEMRAGGSERASGEEVGGIVLSSTELAGYDVVASSPAADAAVSPTTPADDVIAPAAMDDENAPAAAAVQPAEVAWLPDGDAVELAFVFQPPASAAASEASDLRFALRTAGTFAPAEPEVTAALPEPTIDAASTSVETAPVQAKEPDTAAATELTECPRDWVDVPGMEIPTGSDCQTLTALLRPSASVDELMALKEAASQEAEIIEAALPRLPKPRPEPTADMLPARRVASHRSDWPASPPPNCGSQHAYWRFTNRKTGAKEWYCR